MARGESEDRPRFSYSAELSEYLSVRSKPDKTVLFTNTVKAPEVLQLRAAGWDLTLKHGSTEQSQKRVFNDFLKISNFSLNFYQISSNFLIEEIFFFLNTPSSDCMLM